MKENATKISKTRIIATDNTLRFDRDAGIIFITEISATVPSHPVQIDVTDRVAEAVNIAQKTRKSLCPRLRRLEMLLEAAESLRKEEPHLELGDIPERVRALLLDEYRKLNWHVVSPIVNGCAQEAIYEGTPEDCKKYVQRLVEKDPAIKNNLIITPV